MASGSACEVSVSPFLCFVPHTAADPPHALGDGVRHLHPTPSGDGNAATSSTWLVTNLQHLMGKAPNSVAMNALFCKLL